MIVRLYEDEKGKSPFEQWLKTIKCHQTKSRLYKELTRFEYGLVTNVKSLGSGLLEKKLDFGKGYRVYFGYHNDEIIIILGGSDKSNQQEMVDKAKINWANYKKNKSSDADTRKGRNDNEGIKRPHRRGAKEQQ